MRTDIITTAGALRAGDLLAAHGQREIPFREPGATVLATSVVGGLVNVALRLSDDTITSIQVPSDWPVRAMHE